MFIYFSEVSCPMEILSMDISGILSMETSTTTLIIIGVVTIPLGICLIVGIKYIIFKFCRALGL